MGKLEIIGLSGKASSGKDFIFENYIRPLGYYRFALADHFKIWAVGKGSATYEEVFHTKPPHIRKILQQTGTEEGRNVYGEDVWCNTALAWMTHLTKTWGIEKYCVTDIRFPNEAAFVKRNGGKVFRIHAPKRVANSSLNEEARRHVSETSLDEYMEFHGYILNDPEDSPFVERRINILLGTSVYANQH